MTQNDLLNGRVNIRIGFAALRPAEFVVIRITQTVAESRPEESAGGEVTRMRGKRGHRSDPYRDFRFRIRWGETYVAGFSAMSALESTAVKDREPGSGDGLRQMTGRSRFGAITLSRGVTHDRVFENWANLGAGRVAGPDAERESFRRDIIVDVFDEAGVRFMSYKFFLSWVSEYQAMPELDASAEAVAIQSIKIENEGWESCQRREP